MERILKMGSIWRKAKLSLFCSLGESTTVVESSVPSSRRFSDASSAPTTTNSSQRTCAICLCTVKSGQGNAIFTAECSHSFHFNCIASNVKHGNQTCPICRTKWKQIPFQSPPDLSRGRSTNNTSSWARAAWVSALRRILPHRADANRHDTTSIPLSSNSQVLYDDDEPVDHQPEITHDQGSFNKDVAADANSIGAIEVKTYPEVSVVSRSASYDNFTVLIHLKALTRINCGVKEANLPVVSQNSRAPVDLVTVLDVSGSMTGSKLDMLKQAMGFLIHQLGPSDRLSVIAFSDTARRLFPLRRMTDTGRQEALQAVNGLVSDGGTNICGGLREGAKVLTERKWKDPVGCIMLLSDGRDTYTARIRGAVQKLRLPSSIRFNGGTGVHIPVHSFGFGTNHDSALLHSICERTGGTFSFIETESMIQDAFAQCIGGLLSVVVQNLEVKFECIHPMLQLKSIKAGSYKTTMVPDARLGFIDVGYLYAEEERDFLVTIDIPVDDQPCNEMSLLKVRCVYRDPITKKLVTVEEEANELKIPRPADEINGDVVMVVSMEVDRQRNRLQVAEAIAEARAAAERGDLAGAVSVLNRCLEALSQTVSMQAGDQFCLALDAQLREMQKKLSNIRVYESSGRAYILSGMNSHLWQRATTLGDSTDTIYQTQTMSDMVSLSHTVIFGSP